MHLPCGYEFLGSSELRSSFFAGFISQYGLEHGEVFAFFAIIVRAQMVDHHRHRFVVVWLFRGEGLKMRQEFFDVLLKVYR
jgi:hypothetical protein